ncbi:Peptidase family M48 [Actinopolymorpha cephalotaxi]|uniref:Peptidase family M48 n=1 Tax=Actinopolymorpha cephalotaxi TaxID=504797 RepID=A0A1I3AKI7_9ACTN|nr:M56 family metallopeptidase [Actinopolymorpha cephalotaxi]NYH82207.1 Zn-dependent protease with chaperone function [Actinopolymorpha cephalotaxi]SFH50588.1 Peptidase family M48 [Actinopolymorpha cephalotaxi]
MTPVVLGALALLLTWPVPELLGRARWPSLVPRAALVLWQALALAAVLAALGAGLSLGTDVLLHPGQGAARTGLQLAVTALTVVVAVRLAWATVQVAVRTRARRRHHRMVVDLVGTPGERLGDPARLHDEESGVRVLAESTPFAYCLPGVRCSRVVVSSGALDQLAPEELEAVLAHERAHLRARHDLVLEAFTALRQAFPRWVRSRTAFDRAHLLVEMLADDAARRRVGAPPVARALVTLASTPAAPAGGLAAGGTGTLARIRRLAQPGEPHRVLATTTYLAAAALVVVPTLTLAVPWLARLAEHLA